MYKNPFYLTEPVWNNAFSFNERVNKKLYVPSLIKIKNFDDIKLQQDKEKIAFEDFDFNNNMSTNYWLENFYEIDWNWKKIYLFDNHNHALFFWYLAKEKWLVQVKNNILFHIDEHADSRNPNENLEKTDLKSIFNYTNFSKINVWNYIVPAEEEWLIWKTIQIRNTSNLEEYLENKNKYEGSIILNLDLDFFQPDLDFINFELKKKVILDIAKKSSIITVSTSPFFINQELAVKKFKDIFS
jgi:hypothetical protein